MLVGYITTKAHITSVRFRFDGIDLILIFKSLFIFLGEFGVSYLLGNTVDIFSIKKLELREIEIRDREKEVSYLCVFSSKRPKRNFISLIGWLMPQ